MKYPFRLLFLLLSLSIINNSIAQNNIGIKEDNTAPDPAAKLDIQSTNKGILIPRMTQAQRGLINPAPQGLIVYQIDGTSGLYYNASSIPSIQNWYRLINIG